MFHINSSNAKRHIPHLFKIGNNFLSITVIGWWSDLFEKYIEKDITNFIDYSTDDFE